MTEVERIDRAAAVRLALRRLVAERGFHGTSMSAVAEQAGVATGTAYVHYQSKDELVLATYAEVKQELGLAATEGLDQAGDPRARFARMGRSTYSHLMVEQERARFLIQVDASPFAHQAHEQGLGGHDPIMAEATRPDMATLLRPLPPPVLFDLGFGPMIRAAAGGVLLADAELEHLIEACWQAITVSR